MLKLVLALQNTADSASMNWFKWFKCFGCPFCDMNMVDLTLSSRICNNLCFLTK